MSEESPRELPGLPPGKCSPRSSSLPFLPRRSPQAPPPPASLLNSPLDLYSRTSLPGYQPSPSAMDTGSRWSGDARGTRVVNPGAKVNPDRFCGMADSVAMPERASPYSMQHDQLRVSELRRMSHPNGTPGSRKSSVSSSISSISSPSLLNRRISIDGLKHPQELIKRQKKRPFWTILRSVFQKKDGGRAARPIHKAQSLPNLSKQAAAESSPVPGAVFPVRAEWSTSDDEGDQLSSSSRSEWEPDQVYSDEEDFLLRVEFSQPADETVTSVLKNPRVVQRPEPARRIKFEVDQCKVVTGSGDVIPLEHLNDHFDQENFDFLEVYFQDWVEERDTTISSLLVRLFALEKEREALLTSIGELNHRKGRLEGRLHRCTCPANQVVPQDRDANGGEYSGSYEQNTFERLNMLGLDDRVDGDQGRRLGDPHILHSDDSPSPVTDRGEREEMSEGGSESGDRLGEELRRAEREREESESRQTDTDDDDVTDSMTSVSRSYSTAAYSTTSSVARHDRYLRSSMDRLGCASFIDHDGDDDLLARSQPTRPESREEADNSMHDSESNNREEVLPTFPTAEVTPPRSTNQENVAAATPPLQAVSRVHLGAVVLERGPKRYLSLPYPSGSLSMPTSPNGARPLPSRPIPPLVLSPNNPIPGDANNHSGDHSVVTHRQPQSSPRSHLNVNPSHKWSSSQSSLRSWNSSLGGTDSGVDSSNHVVFRPRPQSRTAPARSQSQSSMRAHPRRSPSPQLHELVVEQGSATLDDAGQLRIQVEESAVITDHDASLHTPTEDHWHPQSVRRYQDCAGCQSFRLMLGVLRGDIRGLQEQMQSLLAINRQATTQLQRKELALRQLERSAFLHIPSNPTSAARSQRSLSPLRTQSPSRSSVASPPPKPSTPSSTESTEATTTTTTPTT